MSNIDQSLRTTSGRRIGGSDLGLCLTRLHHDRFTPHRKVIDEVRARDIARGFEHEGLVLQRLTELHRDIVDIDRGPTAAERTQDAMNSAAPFITSGRLESRDGASVGEPDLLVWIDDGYAAVEIKNHKLVGSKGIPAVIAPLAEITDIADDTTKFRAHRRRDLLQVAHYVRLLGEAGMASSARVGGVIGSEQPYSCMWVDLTHGDPSILDEYHAAFAAAKEALKAGSQQPTTPLHEPWWRAECGRCDWADLCRSQLEARDDVTLLTWVNRDVRETLASDHVTTVSQVAALDADDARMPDASVVLQARARTSNQLLRRDPGDGAVTVPMARREVDFDIETYGGEIYLAGFLITQDNESKFEPVVNWEGTEEGEAAVVSEMFAKLADLSDEDTLVLHWTEYERRILAMAGERHGLSIRGSASVDEWFDEYAVDLCAWTRNALVSPNGYGLKTIAPMCGFSWRDDDPGGRQSEIWFERVVAGDDSMKRRLLAYNEDDVVAQLAIRRWIQTKDNGPGPGSAIPSVHSGLWRSEAPSVAHPDARVPSAHSVEPSTMNAPKAP